jgi:hypothetical protein
MIIIGHTWIKSQRFCKIFSLEDISKTKANDIVVLEALVDSSVYAQHCQAESISFALMVDSIDDAIFANLLGAKYIICTEDMALIIQPIAEGYLFDTRILVTISSDKEISKIAKQGIDGVIFAEAIF